MQYDTAQGEAKYEGGGGLEDKRGELEETGQAEEGGVEGRNGMEDWLRRDLEGEQEERKSRQGTGKGWSLQSLSSIAAPKAPLSARDREMQAFEARTQRA